MGVNAQLQTPAALSRHKNPQFPLDRGLGGPQNRSARSGEKKNFALAGTRTPAVQPLVRQFIISAIQTPTQNRFCSDLVSNLGLSEVFLLEPCC
jgi:hypothetical protein